MREVVLTEGVRLLGAHGGAGVTALRISEGTGVARSTIYRHWPDPPSLLLAVVEHGIRPDHPTEVTGDLERDLQTVLRGLRARLRLRPFRRVFATLLDQANHDDAFAEPQQRLVEGVLRPVREVLSEAVERQQLPASLDFETASLVLAGPLLAQHVMVRAPIPDTLVERVIASFLAAHSR